MLPSFFLLSVVALSDSVAQWGMWNETFTQGSWPGERLHHEPIYSIWTIMWWRQLLKALGKHSVRFWHDPCQHLRGLPPHDK